VTSLSDELFSFIGSSFRSVWALELLLLLKREHRSWSREELINTLRASELVVNKAIDELVAAGLISVEGDGARYMPVSEDIAKNVTQVEKVYSARPDAVRRAIVSASASGATAFADAFRLRKD
jgi:predicted transcriptional regulator